MLLWFVPDTFVCCFFTVLVAYQALLWLGFPAFAAAIGAAFIGIPFGLVVKWAFEEIIDRVFEQAVCGLRLDKPVLFAVMWVMWVVEWFFAGLLRLGLKDPEIEALGKPTNVREHAQHIEDLRIKPPMRD